MNEFYFLVRYTPFWAIPTLLMGAEFAYLFWIRKKKKLVVFCMALSFVSFLSLVFYFVMGGPEHSVKAMMDLVWYYTR